MLITASYYTTECCTFSLNLSRDQIVAGMKSLSEHEVVGHTFLGPALSNVSFMFTYSHPVSGVYPHHIGACISSSFTLNNWEEMGKEPQGVCMTLYIGHKLINTAV